MKFTNAKDSRFLPMAALVGLAFFLTVGPAYSADEPTEGTKAAEEGMWTENFEAAKAKAAKEGKDLLINFTGSDWCGWCKKLDKEVFATDAYMNEATKRFVHVKLDFPSPKAAQSVEIKEQNKTLQERYQPRGFPTILLTDEQGRPYAQTGYERGGPENYLRKLANLRMIRKNRDAAFSAAENLEGTARAEKLSDGLVAVGEEMAVKHYQATIEEINRLDPSVGKELKDKMLKAASVAIDSKKFATIMELVRASLGEGRTPEDLDQTIAQIDAIIDSGFEDPARKNYALFLKAQMLVMNGHGKEARKITEDLAEREDVFQGGGRGQLLRVHAWALCLTGEKEKGVQLFEKVIEETDNDHWRSMHLGAMAKAMESVGDKEGAIEAFERAVAVATNAAVKHSYEQQLQALKNGEERLERQSPDGIRTR